MEILLIREMCCILPIVCSNFPGYSISDLLRGFPINGSAAISSFLHVESILKGVSTLLKIQLVTIRLLVP